MATLQTAFPGQGQQRGWSGIVPLHSTRAEVEAQLGRSSDACNCRYSNATEVVVIDYAKGPCKGPPHGWNVPAGTVLQITVSSKAKLPFAQLALNEKDYVISQGVGERVVYYMNLPEGIKYSVSDGAVHSISYIPSSTDVALRCQGFPDYDGGVRAYQPYAAFSAKAQMIDQRLGEFGLRLAEDASLKGFIITYAGKVARRGEAKLMAEKAKLSLTTRLGISAGRIIVIDGGFRETPEYELFLLPPELPSPAPTPTLSSTQVRILQPRVRHLRRNK